MSLVLCYHITRAQFKILCEALTVSLRFDCQFRVENHFVRSDKDMMNGEDINFVSIFFGLPHDPSCTISCMNKRALMQRLEIQ